MDIHSEFILGGIGTIVLGILGYLLARSIAQIDENLGKVWSKIDKLSESANDCHGRHDITEDRFKYLTERVTRLEDKRNGSA